MNTNKNFTAPSSSTQYECNFSGDSGGYVAVMMWRNAPANQGQALFAIERSLDANGAYTEAYVTLYAAGLQPMGGGSQVSRQRTLLFGVGAGPDSQTASNGAWYTRGGNASSGSYAFNGSIPMDTAAPNIGFYDYPCTVVGVGQGPDFVEGVTFSVTLYGASRTLHALKGWSVR